MLLASADSWGSRHTDPQTRQMDMEFCMLLRMLLGCGFRLGEPLAARVKDINFSRGTILIRHAKNNKQRVVPMDVTLTRMLEKVLHCDGNQNRAGKPPVSIGQEKKGQLLQKELSDYGSGSCYSKPTCVYLERLIPEVNVFIVSVITLPSILLYRQRKKGRPVNDSVPFLSVYLGHHDMNETEKYLKFSSDMFPEYTELFEDYAVSVFMEVGDEEK